jgi:hypothetical protein
MLRGNMLLLMQLDSGLIFTPKTPYSGFNCRPSSTGRHKNGRISASDAGWSSLAARRAHNPKVVGSNPAPATKQ